MSHPSQRPERGDDAATVVTTEPMRATHREAVAAIYREGLETTEASFETEVPSWREWDAAHLSTCRIVAREGGTSGPIVGWAALSPVSGRCVYGGVAEVSVYVAAAARGRGVGKQLLRALIDASERQGLWTLQAGILVENAASIALHVGCGFRRVGVRERIGQLRGRWRSVLLLERRSRVVGTDDSSHG